MIYTGGVDALDVDKIVRTMGDLNTDAKWQIMEIKGNEDSPLTLEISLMDAYVFHWNVTLALKSGPAHSVLIGMMPNTDNGSEPGAKL